MQGYAATLEAAAKVAAAATTVTAAEARAMRAAAARALAARSVDSNYHLFTHGVDSKTACCLLPSRSPSAGHTPLHHTVLSGSNTPADAKVLIASLVEGGTELEATDIRGCTPLDLAHQRQGEGSCLSSYHT